MYLILDLSHYMHYIIYIILSTLYFILYIIYTLYAFLQSIKLFEYRIGIKFYKGPLAAEQNNYTGKIVKVYIVYDLDSWPRKPTNNFKFKNCLFGATSVVNNNDKGKYVYCGYRIKFDSAGSWSFDNDVARNVIIFGVDNSSSSRANNSKKKFLVLAERWTFGINGRFGSPETNFSINFSKVSTKFCFSLHCNADNSYLFDNGSEIFKFKAGNKSVNFPIHFCLGSISNGFSGTETRELSLNAITFIKYLINSIK